jgi:hypothetical protein
MRDTAKVAHPEKAMDVVEAVSTAKRHILSLFQDENILNLGLEEAFFDENQNVWHITLGFSRRWDYPHGALPQTALDALTQISAGPKRSYKIVEISNIDNNVISVKNYTT